MLYTLSHSHSENLNALLAQITANDALVLWQDGVLQAVKNPQLFATLPNVFVLENDLIARGLSLSCDLPTVSMTDLVELTERFYPQVAL